MSVPFTETVLSKGTSRTWTVTGPNYGQNELTMVTELEHAAAEPLTTKSNTRYSMAATELNGATFKPMVSPAPCMGTPNYFSTTAPSMETFDFSTAPGAVVESPKNPVLVAGPDVGTHKYVSIIEPNVGISKAVKTPRPDVRSSNSPMITELVAETHKPSIGAGLHVDFHKPPVVAELASEPVSVCGPNIGTPRPLIITGPDVTSMIFRCDVCKFPFKTQTSGGEGIVCVESHVCAAAPPEVLPVVEIVSQSEVVRSTSPVLCLRTSQTGSTPKNLERKAEKYVSNNVCDFILEENEKLNVIRPSRKPPKEETPFSKLSPNEFCILCHYNVSHVDRSCSKLKSKKQNRNCYLCVEIFTCNSSLDKHLRTVHQEERLYKCETCGKTFANSDTLAAHIKRHDEKPFRCFCGRGFVHETRLATHLETHTKRYKCSWSKCGQRFQEKSTLDRHMRIHTGETPFLCSVCGLMFQYRYRLLSHKHGEEAIFSCHICRRSFVRKTDRINHLRRHRKKYQHECTKCGKGFQLRKVFRKHVKRHKEGKQFRTDVMNLNIKNRLSSKVDSNGGETGFPCHICGRTFRRRGDRTRHIRRHVSESRVARESRSTQLAKEADDEVNEGQGHRGRWCEGLGPPTRFRSEQLETSTQEQEDEPEVLVLSVD